MITRNEREAMSKVLEEVGLAKSTAGRKSGYIVPKMNIDWDLLSTFHDCRRKFMHEIEDRKDRQQERPALESRTLYHHLFVEYMKLAYSDRSSDYINRLDPDSERTTLNSNMEEQAEAISAIAAYDDLYIEQDLKNYSFIQKRSILSKIMKKGFGSNITDKTPSRQKMFFTNMIDFMIQERTTNDVYIFQNVISEVVDNNARHHALLRAAIEEQSSNHKIKGVIFNCIRKPKIKKRRVETLTEYSNRVTAHCKEKNKSAEGVQDTIFYRERVKFSAEQKREALDDLWDASGEMQDLVGKMRNGRTEKKQSFFYKNLNCCNRNFKRCKYYDQCGV